MRRWEKRQNKKRKREQVEKNQKMMRRRRMSKRRKREQAEKSQNMKRWRRRRERRRSEMMGRRERMPMNKKMMMIGKVKRMEK